MTTRARALLLTASVSFALCLLPACKGGRSKLEQLVPDGATGMASVDMKALSKSDLYTDMWTFAKSASAETGDTVGKLESDCDLKIDEFEAYVVGFDALTQSFMAAVRWKNLGKPDTLSCIHKVIADSGAPEAFKLGQDGGTTKLELADGQAVGWAPDDDTLVLSSKGWEDAVKDRIKGKGKGAADNNLKEAIALADTSAHMWMAGEVPPIAKPFLDDTPAKGLERGAASFKLEGDDLDVVITVEFSSDGQASDLKAAAEKQLEGVKPMAERAGVPADVIDGIELSTDGPKLVGKVQLPIKKMLDETTKAFGSYVAKAKTSEARVQLAKMFDGASAFFNEEHVAPGGALEVAPHGCPAMPGANKGASGIVPPLSVDCSKGPGGHCVPKVGGGSGPGEYDAKLWTDNQVFDGLNFQMQDPHFFHYQFRYDNDPTGFGTCQFTAQAFADLDGDGTFSTYERAGAGDENGVQSAAGLYIVQETE